MTDTLQRAKFAQVLGAVNSRAKEEPVNIMTSKEYKEDILSHVNPDKDKENEAIIKASFNNALKKPGWLAGFTKHVMEEIGTDPTSKNRKYVYGVIVNHIDELLDSAV